MLSILLSSYRLLIHPQPAAYTVSHGEGFVFSESDEFVQYIHLTRLNNSFAISLDMTCRRNMSEINYPILILESVPAPQSVTYTSNAIRFSLGEVDAIVKPVENYLELELENFAKVYIVLKRRILEEHEKVYGTVEVTLREETTQ